jgi:hypothetical protein
MAIYAFATLGKATVDKLEVKIWERIKPMSDLPAATGIRRKLTVKQDEISDYLSRFEPFATRLTLCSIIGAAIAAGLSGEVVRNLVQESSASTLTIVIGVLAACSSLIAAIAGGIHKAIVEPRLPGLQKCAAKLEGLAALLDGRQISDEAASKRLQRYFEECPRIPPTPPDFDEVKGSVSEPVSGQSVAETFLARGTAENVGPGVHLWLAVEIGDRIWPKEGRIAVDAAGQWSQPVFEDGGAEEFGLSLWAANAEANRKLRLWLDAGNRDRIFPELRPLPGMRRLSRVTGLHQEGRGK